MKKGIAIGGGIVLFGITAGVVRYFTKKNVPKLEPVAPPKVDQRFDQTGNYSEYVTVDAMTEACEYMASLYLQQAGAQGVLVDPPKVGLFEKFIADLIYHEKTDARILKDAVMTFTIGLDEHLEVNQKVIVHIGLARLIDRYRKMDVKKDPDSDPEQHQLAEEVCEIANALFGMVEVWFGGQQSAEYKALMVIDEMMAEHGHIVRSLTSDELSDFYNTEVAKFQMDAPTLNSAAQ